MKLSELFPSKSAWLSSKNIDGPTKLTIASIGMEENYQEDPTVKNPDDKGPVITFSNEKKLRLNKTNGIMLGELFGEDCDAWVGKEVVVYVDKTVRGPSGKVTGGLRIRGA